MVLGLMFWASQVHALSQKDDIQSWRTLETSTAAKYVLLTTGCPCYVYDLTVGSGLVYDYDSTEFMQEQSTSPGGPPWNTSPWNTTSWGAGHPVMQDWLTGAGRGQNVSLLQSGSASQKATWHSTDYRLEVADDLL